MVAHVILELTFTALRSVRANTLVLRQTDQWDIALANDEHVAQTESRN
jgi:hypothetical protein